MRPRKLAAAVVLGLVGGVALALATPSPAQDGGAPAPAKPAEDPKLTEAKRVVTAMRAEIERIAPRRFETEVKVAWQTADEFKAHILKQLDDEIPPEMEAGYTGMLVALRLIPEGANLRDLLTETAAAAALAHYVPEDDTFYVLKEQKGLERNKTFLHELQHAMQDQVLGLDRIHAESKKVKDQGDRSQAARFVFEGEATLLAEIFYGMKSMGMDPVAQAAQIEPLLRMQCLASFDQAMAMQQAQAGMMDPETRKQIEDQAKLPRYFLHSIRDAYTRGLWLTWRAWRRGGWEAVDKLFTELPTSTEQVLHPDEKLFGDQREEPIPVALPDLSAVLPANRKKLMEDTLGEHNILILLEWHLPRAEAARAAPGAAGWGGDRVRVYAGPGGAKPLLTWLTVWDTPKDANEFAEAYLAVAEGNPARGWPAAVAAVKDRAVAVVEGAEGELAGDVAAALLAAAPPVPAAPTAPK